MTSAVLNSGKTTKDVIHMPNLGTVIMVENTLRKTDGPISKEELKRRLPRKVMHQTLNIVLDYLQESGKVFIGTKGVDWIFVENPELEEKIKKSVRVL